MMFVEIRCGICGGIVMSFQCGSTQQPEFKANQFLNDDICDECLGAIMRKPGVQEVIDERRKLNVG